MTELHAVADREGHKTIDIVCFSLDLADEHRQSLYQLLSDDERQRAARYRFDKHRNRFICGRGQIREILADRGKCLPESIRFFLNQYGKPYVKQPDTVKYLQFNASSSEELGVIAISSVTSLGVDIEKIKPDKANNCELIVKNEFTSDEYEYYKSCEVAERETAFYSLWTCKEAYLKALGIGLNAKLDSFSIDLRGDNPLIRYTDLEEVESSGMYLYRLDITDEFTACLCLDIPGCSVDLTKWISSDDC